LLCSSGDAAFRFCRFSCEDGGSPHCPQHATANRPTPSASSVATVQFRQQAQPEGIQVLHFGHCLVKDQNMGDVWDKFLRLLTFPPGTTPSWKFNGISATEDRRCRTTVTIAIGLIAEFRTLSPSHHTTNLVPHPMFTCSYRLSETTIHTY
jgi:hypothetical protein